MFVSRLRYHKQVFRRFYQTVNPCLIQGFFAIIQGEKQLLHHGEVERISQTISSITMERVTCWSSSAGGTGKPRGPSWTDSAVTNGYQQTPGVYSTKSCLGLGNQGLLTQRVFIKFLNFFFLCVLLLWIIILACECPFDIYQRYAKLLYSNM